MVTFPGISTDRCVLEQFAEKHLTERYVSWLNDPDVVKFSEQRHRTHDLVSCRKYFDSFADTPHYFVAIVSKDQALGHIGNLNAYVDVNNGTADVGILLGEKGAWGQGIGTEVWSAFCKFLLTDRKLRKVTAGTSANNAGMLSIMRRSGMREDGKRVKQLIINGREVDIVHAALFDEPFPKL